MRPELQAIRTTGSILSITNVIRCYNCMIINDIMIFYTLSLLFGVSRVGEVPGPWIHHRGAAIPNGPPRCLPPFPDAPLYQRRGTGGGKRRFIPPSEQGGARGHRELGRGGGIPGPRTSPQPPRPARRPAKPSAGQGAMCIATRQGRIIVAWSQLIVELPGAIRSPAEAARSLDLDRRPRHSRTTTRTPAPPPPAPGRSPPSALCPWPRRSSLLPSIGPPRRCEQPGGGAFDEGRIVGGHARPTQRPTKPAKPIIQRPTRRRGPGRTHTEGGGVARVVVVLVGLSGSLSVHER